MCIRCHGSSRRCRIACRAKTVRCARDSGNASTDKTLVADSRGLRALGARSPHAAPHDVLPKRHQVPVPLFGPPPHNTLLIKQGAVQGARMGGHPARQNHAPARKTLWCHACRGQLASQTGCPHTAGCVADGPAHRRRDAPVCPRPASRSRLGDLCRHRCFLWKLLHRPKHYFSL